MNPRGSRADEQEISPTNSAAIQLLRSEACKPSEVASKLPEKSPCYVFYSFPTPPPPKPVKAAAPPKAAPAAARNMFQATTGGPVPVEASDAPRWDAEETEKKTEDTKEKDDNAEDEVKKEETEENTEETGEITEGREGSVPTVSGIDLSAEPKAVSPTPPPASPSPPPQETKGRVVFIYWCPSGSPVRFRMIYSTTVRGIQQDAIDKAGVEIIAKMETSDKSDLDEKHIRDEVPSKPKHSSSLPVLPTAVPRMFGQPASGSTTPAFGAPAPARSFAKPSGPAPVFGAPAPAGFGRPRPVHASNSSPTTAEEEDDSKDRVKNAFDAFGPRVNSASGFSRPKPARRQ